NPCRNVTAVWLVFCNVRFAVAVDVRHLEPAVRRISPGTDVMARTDDKTGGTREPHTHVAACGFVLDRVRSTVTVDVGHGEPTIRRVAAGTDISRRSRLKAGTGEKPSGDVTIG